MAIFKYHLIAILLGILLSLYGAWDFWNNSDPIRYMNGQTINSPVAKIETRLIPSEEGTPDDTLYQHLSAEGIPVFYSQNIKTGVCFDNKCRLLTITLYWNPSGRYLGFVLPKKEYLSKKDHDPFTVSEYEKLNRLLADPNLPLGSITYNELVLASKPSLQGLDGVSGATSKDMLSYVIEGAAYTTHKLYSILYGPSQLVVKEWTTELITEELILEIIASASIQDVFWGLEILKGKLHLYPSITRKILEMGASEDYSISEKALSVFVSSDLRDLQIQTKILEIFPMLDIGRKKTVLELFKETTELYPQTVEFFNSDLPKMEIPLKISIIDIYKKQGIKDYETQEVIRNLSISGNPYLSQKAMDYLNWAQ